MKKPGILLDRDGVLIVNREDYTKCIAEVELLPGTLDAVTCLWQKGYTICVVTNQSGVAKGRYSHQDVKEIHQFIEEQLRSQQPGEIYWYYCPHRDEDACDCRKPKPGLLLQAIDQHQLQAENIWMVGDHLRDIEAGQRAGCQTCLVLTGLGESMAAKKSDIMPQRICADLLEFVRSLPHAEKNET